MAIGFNTPSKAKNEILDKAKEGILIADVIDKVNLTASFIVSPEFNKLSPEQKAQVLFTFANLSIIANSL